MLPEYSHTNSESLAQISTPTAEIQNFLGDCFFIGTPCTSRAYAMMPVRLSVTEVHWRIIANLGFKFRSTLPRIGCRAACGRIISRHAIQC